MTYIAPKALRVGAYLKYIHTYFKFASYAYLPL